MTLFRKLALAITLFTVGGSAAFAQSSSEDSLTRSIRNSMHIMEHLHSVLPEHIGRALANVENGTLKRRAPEQPVWIVEVKTGSILYYQGEKTFKGQDASRLVDDKGSRFGERAVTLGKNSRSAWLSVVLGGATHQAYCKSQHPFVVCSLAT